MRILIIGSGFVLSSGIKSLLDSIDDVSTRMLVSADENRILPEIERYAPDVIITDGEQDCVNAYRYLLEEGRMRKVRLILPDTHENRLWICELYEMKLTSANDLIEAIGLA